MSSLFCHFAQTHTRARSEISSGLSSHGVRRKPNRLSPRLRKPACDHTRRNFEAKASRANRWWLAGHPPRSPCILKECKGLLHPATRLVNSSLASLPLYRECQDKCFRLGKGCLQGQGTRRLLSFSRSVRRLCLKGLGPKCPRQHTRRAFTVLRPQEPKCWGPGGP